MVLDPDKTELHIADYCQGCEACISNNESCVIEKRQVFDLPVIELKVTEHQVFETKDLANNNLDILM